MYMLTGAPFRKDKRTGSVYDRAGEQVRLMGDSRAILKEIVTSPKWSHAKIVSCELSRINNSMYLKFTLLLYHKLL